MIIKNIMMHKEDIIFVKLKWSDLNMYKIKNGTTIIKFDLQRMALEIKIALRIQFLLKIKYNEIIRKAVGIISNCP